MPDSAVEVRLGPKDDQVTFKVNTHCIDVAKVRILRQIMQQPKLQKRIIRQYDFLL